MRIRTTWLGMAVTLIGILFLAVQLWTFTWILQLQEDDGNHLLSSSSSSSSSSKRRKTATHSLLEQWKPENNCNQTNPHNNDRNAKNMMAAMMPHFDIAQELKDYQNLPVLVVGGTDGSGTRAVTAMLQTMGVPVVSDDPVTLDVHAAEIFCGQGWPALVELVLSYTNNHDGSCCGNYEWGDLPQEVQELLEREITTLLDTWETKYQVQLHLRKLQEHHLRKIITYPNERIIQRATNVKFAIKAPVSMLLLPVLTKIMGKIQFLHVLRDGRDIALSNNQSPVVKFYNLSYPMDYEQRLKRYSGAFKPVKGIQLWQDWNLQVRDWAMKQKSENNLDRYYYSSIRSEDLVKNDPWNQWRYLADIIGFKGDLPKLCCLFGQNHAEARDYGTSARVRDVTQQQQPYRLKDYRVDFKTLESWTARWQFKISHLYPATTQKTKKDLVDVGLALSEQWQQVVGTTTSNSNSTYDEHAYSTWQSIRSKLKSLTNNFSLEGSPSHQKFSKLLDSSFWNGTAPKKIIDPNLYQKLVQTMQDQQQNKPHHHQVEQRYGKWERILANQTKLSDSLHREGARALKAFGYEPFIPWIHPSHVSNSEFVCDIKTAC